MILDGLSQTINLENFENVFCLKSFNIRLQLRDLSIRWYPSFSKSLRIRLFLLN